MSDFEIKKFDNASDFEVKLIYIKNRFRWKFCFKKITFGSFYPKKRQLMQLCVFSKSKNCIKREIKTVFLARLLRIIRFWNKFLTTRQIRIKIFKISQFLVNFTQLVIFLYRKLYSVSDFETSFFTTRQVLNGTFNNATDFHVKLVSKHQAFLDNLLSKSLFLSIYTLKMSKLTFSHFLRKFVSGSDVSEKKHALNRKLREKSDCEPVFFTTPQTFEEKKILLVKVLIE